MRNKFIVAAVIAALGLTACSADSTSGSSSSVQTSSTETETTTAVSTSTAQTTIEEKAAATEEAYSSPVQSETESAEAVYTEETPAPVETAPAAEVYTEAPEPETTPAEILADAPAEQIPSLTRDMAYEGVSSYCISAYGSDEQGNAYTVNSEEYDTDSEYAVKFRSTTGAFTYFYVNRETGDTRIVQINPIDNSEEYAGTINVYDYLN